MITSLTQSFGFRNQGATPPWVGSKTNRTVTEPKPVASASAGSALQLQSSALGPAWLRSPLRAGCYEATTFKVGELCTTRPRVGPSPVCPTTGRPWAGLHNPFRIGGGGVEG
jgi:hypothetical protein